MKIASVPVSAGFPPMFEAHPEGKFVALPLVVSHVSALAIEAACRANWKASMQSCMSDASWDELMESERDMYRTELRAAITALAAALGEEG